MQKKYTYPLLMLFYLLALFTFSCKAQDKTASVLSKMLKAVSNETLYKAVNSAEAGSVITIKDGVYKDIQLIVRKSGRSGQPIHIKAENPGKVIFSGDAKVELRGDHLILEGIFFKDGNRNVDEWKTHGPGLVAIYGSYNRITQCAFDAFDEANSAYITTSLTEDGKVPQYCRIDHCSFTNKITFDQVINLNNTFQAVKDGKGGPPMYHRVDHNFFSNPPKPGNAGGGIRIGYWRNDTGRCLIDSNLFMRQDSEPEIITSKSRENVYYANTFINCQGTLNFRHGDRQAAVNNFFIGTDTKFGYGGMFVWGSEHIIASNYFELPKTISSRGNAALYLNPGAEASEHALAFDILIANNLFMDNKGYAIHFNPLDERRKESCKENGLVFQTPHHISLKGNLFFTAGTSDYTFFKNDYRGEHYNVWENNLAWGSELGIAPAAGIHEQKFQVNRASDIYKPDASAGYEPARFRNLAPIQGINLDLNELINRGVVGKPLTMAEAGPAWLKTIPEYALRGKLPATLQQRFNRVLQRGKNE